MTGTSIVEQIVSILGAGITGVASFIGSGLNSLVNDLFFTTTGTGSDAVTTMSMFGIMVVVFAGISLAIGQPVKADLKSDKNGGCLSYRLIPC